MRWCFGDFDWRDRWRRRTRWKDRKRRIKTREFISMAQHHTSIRRRRTTESKWRHFWGSKENYIKLLVRVYKLRKRAFRECKDKTKDPAFYIIFPKDKENYIKTNEEEEKQKYTTSHYKLHQKGANCHRLTYTWVPVRRRATPRRRVE